MTNCAQCHLSFEITDPDRRFYEKVSPMFCGKKFLIPEPKLCPDCRQQRRLVWRNERNLYHRTCGFCKKPIITAHAAENPHIVYCISCWWGGNWSALDYGRDFDFSRPFFEQFNELVLAVPHAAVTNLTVENCDYTNYQNDSRNCYLCFGSGFMEDCQYCDWVYNAKSTFDCSFCDCSELDYMNVDCVQTYRSRFCQDCHTISYCAHCFDCRNCKNCFGCVGLRNKEYHLFNKPIKKEEYEQYMARLKQLQYRRRIEQEVEKLRQAYPNWAARIIQCENCTGDNIENCKHCLDCYNLKESEDCRYVCDAFRMKDCHDGNRNGISELCRETVCGGYYQNVRFTVIGGYISFADYTFECMNSKHIFGSVALNHKDYTIFNKQYTKEDYEKLAARIAEHMQKTGEWGEFFPAALSPFAYNETVANEFFPLSEAEAKAQGFRWRPKDQREYLPPQGDILVCEVTGRNFKLTSQEVRFYKEEGLLMPTRHPNQRYLDRLSLKLPRRLYGRQCTKCQAAIKTPYAPERPEKVVCEACYLKEVY